MGEKSFTVFKYACTKSHTELETTVQWKVIWKMEINYITDLEKYNKYEIILLKRFVYESFDRLKFLWKC